MAGEAHHNSPSNDLLAIKSLRESVPFNAYFMRRVKQRAADINDKFRHDGPEKVDKDEREVLRRILEEYDWIVTKMMANDEAAAKSEALSRPGDGRIGQVG